MSDYLDELYPDWRDDMPGTVEDMVLDNDMVGLKELLGLVDPPVNWVDLAEVAYTDAMKEFLMMRTPWTMEQDEVDPRTNTMEHPYGGVQNFNQVYDEDFDFEMTVPDLESMDVDEGNEYIGTRQLYPPTTDEQQMLGISVEPIIIGTQYASDMLDPEEFPERYPGMPGFQPQIEYSLGIDH